MKQERLKKWLIYLLFTIVIFGGLFFIYKNRFYTKDPRILFFEQIGKPSLVRNNEWVALLKDKFIKNNLDTKVFNNKCYEFWLAEEDKNILRIELHEFHQNGCPGDPNSSPRIETFTINKTTKTIFWYDVVSNKTVDFKEYIRVINQVKK